MHSGISKLEINNFLRKFFWYLTCILEALGINQFCLERDYNIPFQSIVLQFIFPQVTHAESKNGRSNGLESRA